VKLNEHEKFANRDTRAVVLGYSQLGSFKVMLFRQFSENRKIYIRITRDIQLDRHTFPFKEIEFTERELETSDWTDAIILMPRRNEDTYVDSWKQLRCGQCHLFVTGQPVSCKFCKTKNKKHPRGRPGKNCARARCYGHPSNEAQEEPMRGNEEAGVTTVVRPTASSASSSNTPRPVPAAATPVVPSTPSAPPTPSRAAEAAELNMMGPPMLGIGVAKGAKEKKGTGNPKVDRVPLNRPLAGCTKPEAYHELKKMMTQKDQQHLKQMEEVTKCLGLVVRIIDLNSREAKGYAKEGLDEAMNKEWDNLVALNAFNPKEMIERDHVKKTVWNARFVSSRFVCGLKGAEDLATAIYKARLVAGGHNERDVYNNRIIEVYVHIVPASLLTIRVLYFHASCFADGTVATGDVTNAYVTSVLLGDPVYLAPPPQRRNARFVDGVLLLHKALYGLKRSGLDWGTKVRRDLTDIFFCLWVRDIGETSMFRLHNVVIIVATDDFGLGGPKLEVDTLYMKLDLHFGFSQKSKTARYGGVMAGLTREVLPSPFGVIMYRVHQKQYSLYMIEKYEKEHNIVLTPIATPQKHRRDEVDKRLSLAAGYYSDRSSEQVGMWMWLIRGSRYDCGNTVIVLSRRVRCWSQEEDGILHRLYRYLKGTAEIGIVSVVNLQEVRNKQLKMVGRADSDFIGGEATTRSCSSYTSTVSSRPIGTIHVSDILKDKYKTHALLDFSSRTQPSTAYSTPDAETRALADLIIRSLGPLHNCFSQIWDEPLPEEIGTDNAASLAVARSGVSKRLSYLRRTQRVSIGLLSDYCGDPGTTLFKEESLTNGADLGTKAHEAVAHWEHMSRLMMY
jgi:hypothetical protein